MTQERLDAIDAAKRHNRTAAKMRMCAVVSGDKLYFCPCNREGLPVDRHRNEIGVEICEGEPTETDDLPFGIALEYWIWSSYDDAQRDDISGIDKWQTAKEKYKKEMLVRYGYVSPDDLHTDDTDPERPSEVSDNGEVCTDLHAEENADSGTPDRESVHGEVRERGTV